MAGRFKATTTETETVHVDIDFSERTAIVTGGGRGIGKEIAEVIGQTGANTVVAARSVDEIEATVDAIRAEGGTAAALPTDIRDESDIHALVDETIDRFGVPEILINNAGVNLKGDLWEQHVQQVDTMLSVNLRGVFLLTQRFAQEFLSANRSTGRIVNISSVHATQGIPKRIVYSGTKAGIRGLTRGFASTLARDGVTVNSISPGLIQVGRVEETLGSGEPDYDVDRIPAGRVGTPSDVAYTCLFLLTRFAEYITGEDILVDGGVSFTRRPYKLVDEMS